nr:PEPxxWA-CTERM sorting domain-containing protein [Sandarakinorhabdus limnophila]
MSGAIPEPGRWAMLIAGFGLVGAAGRRRRATVAA